MSRYVLIILPLLGLLLAGCPEHTEPRLELAPTTTVAARGRAGHRLGTLRPPRPVRARLVRAR
jgi:hypothetical protein